MRSQIRTPLAMTLTGLLTAGALADTPMYEVIDLGPIDPDIPFAWSEPDGINSLGQVVGRSNNSLDETEATLWLQEPAYGLPQGVNALGFSRAYDINDNGQAVGFNDPPPGDPGYARAYLWDPTTGGQYLGLLGGDHSIAEAVNNAGWVVGSSEMDGNPNIAFQHAFLWDTNEMHDLGTFGGNYSKARDINNHNQVVGFATYMDDDPWNSRLRAAIWLPEPAYGLPEGLNDIDTYSTVLQQFTEARAINDHGQVAIWGAWIGGPYTYTHLWIWLPEPALGLQAGLNPIGGYLGDNEKSAYAQDINIHGDIAMGCIINPNDPIPIFHAILWRQGEWYDLNDCVSLNDQAVWNFESATAINDAGQIAVRGHYFGWPRAALLTPVVQEPCADLDGDNDVDQADLGLLLASYGVDDGGDVNGDGVTDQADLGLLLSQYGADCP